MIQVAVLASGSGSNLQALLDSEDQGRLGAHIRLVVSNRRDSLSLVRAARCGREAIYLASGPSDTEETIARRMIELFEKHSIELVCLAGYLKKLPSSVVQAFAGRVLNIHPAPLPRFGGHGMFGLHVHEAVLESGVAHSGPTVHFVDSNYDTGVVVAHTPVPVLPGDTPESLAARVLVAEHELFPRVVASVAQGRIRLLGGEVRGTLDDN